ncbi:protein toll-like [Bactrocera tryoni]|uniref:protein toll-like n=1 Tax=Bactrocera tryoni TaxID=59916 RepID=UPI001A99E4E1|nr:protein toll-like [Bactrocera tryoni]
MIISHLTRVGIVALVALVLHQYYCHCQTHLEEQSFSRADCNLIAAQNACNCTYDAKYESAKIFCRSADERTEIWISIYERSSVDITCRHAGDSYAVITEELLARLPRLGSISKADFLAIHECVPFTPLLARLGLTQNEVLHIDGLGKLTQLTAQSFGHNRSCLQSVVDLELSAQPAGAQAGQRLNADIFTDFSNVRTVKIDLNITQLDERIFLPLVATLNDFTFLAKLREFPSAAMSPLHQLRVLMLMRHQFGDRLREDDFAPFRLLEYLTLLNCNITKLPARIFASLPALRHLTLNKNELRALPPSLFVAQTQLQSLDLGDNQLASLSRTLFHPATKLTSLTLSRNRFVKLSAEMLPPLGALT